MSDKYTAFKGLPIWHRLRDLLVQIQQEAILPMQQQLEEVKVQPGERRTQRCAWRCASRTLLPLFRSTSFTLMPE